MAGPDDERFRVRPSPPKARGAGGHRGAKRFVSQVLRASQTSSAGAGRPLAGQSARGAEKGRGYVAARLVGSGLGPRSRRVVIKARLVVFANLLSTLRDREVSKAAEVITADTGLRYRALEDGDSVSGTYRRSVQLASGRFAMVSDGLGFSLVPWKPVIEPRLGQSVAGIVRGASVSWDLSRKRGIGI